MPVVRKSELEVKVKDRRKGTVRQRGGDVPDECTPFSVVLLTAYTKVDRSMNGP